MAVPTEHLLKQHGIEIHSGVSALPAEFDPVIEAYPSARSFLTLTYPLLARSLRGGGFTASFRVQNAPDTALGYERFQENTTDHTLHIAQIIHDLYQRQPVLAHQTNKARVLATVAVHDMLELYGGDLSQSIPDNFYDNPRFVAFLRDQNQTYLLGHIEAANHSIINDGHKSTYLDWYNKFAHWYSNEQIRFATELFATIEDPETAQEFADLAIRFEQRTQFVDDADVWLARWGDIAQEVTTIFDRSHGGEVEAYQQQPSYIPFGTNSDRRMVTPAGERPYSDEEVLQIKSIGLSVGRLLEPTAVLLGRFKHEPSAFRALYQESRVLLDKLAQCGYPNNLRYVHTAIEYLAQLAAETWQGKASLPDHLSGIKKTWIEPAKQF